MMTLARQKIQHLILLLPLVALLPGCNESEHVIPQGTPISFTTPDNWGEGTRLTTTEGTDPNTGNPIYNTAFDHGDKIGVYAYYLPGGDATNKQEFMKNQMVEYNTSSQWEYSPIKYWPTMTADKLSFYAYYPYYNPTGTPVDPEAIPFSGFTTDLLYTGELTTGKVSPVPLKFKHALAGIRLKISCADGMTAQLNGIKLLNDDTGNPIPYSGTMNAFTGAVTATGTTNEIVFPFGSTALRLSATAVSADIFIPTYSNIVQGNLTLDCDFTIDGASEPLTFTLPVPTGNSFTAGNFYAYNLKLDEDKSLSVTSITIGDFEEEVVINITVGYKN